MKPDPNGLSVLVALVGLLVGGAAIAGRPVKPPPTPTIAPPVIVDANGAIVGPVVPQPGTVSLGALYRSDLGNIRVFFEVAAGSSSLVLAGGPQLFFDGPNCTGGMYIATSGTSLGADYAGFALDALVAPPMPSVGRPALLIRIGMSSPVSLIPQSKTGSGGRTCDNDPTDVVWTLYPVIGYSFPFVEPFTVN